MATFTFKDPQKTATLDAFRACQSTDDPSFSNFSFKDQWWYPYLNENIIFCSYNVVSDYLDDIRAEYCSDYTMTDSEFIRYKYRPKLFTFDKYNCMELGYMILLINDMYNFKQFTQQKIIAPGVNGMKLLCERIFNANKQALAYYNKFSTGQPIN